MPVEILVAAQDLKGSKKGDVRWFKEAPCAWSTVYVPPKYVIVHVTDATMAQVQEYRKPWIKVYDYEILQDTPIGYRIRVMIDPDVVSVSGINRRIKAGLGNYIQNTYNVVIVSHDDYEAVVDIPKVDGVFDLQALKMDMLDKFQEKRAKRLYYFPEVDVDWAVAQGGYVTLSRAQVLSKVRSKVQD